MTFELPALPYRTDALRPILSREALECYHARHHAAYVKKLRAGSARPVQAASCFHLPQSIHSL